MDNLWNEKKCGDYLGKAVATLQKDRVRGSGPPFAKVGRLVRYDPDVVRAWVASQTVNSTAEAA